MFKKYCHMKEVLQCKSSIAAQNSWANISVGWELPLDVFGTNVGLGPELR